MAKLAQVTLISLCYGLLVACQKPTAGQPDPANTPEPHGTTKPTATVHVATSMMPQLIVGEPLKDVGILELGADQCLYLKLDNGQTILPIITGAYRTPEQIKSRYMPLIGQRVNAAVERSDINLASPHFSAISPGWVNASPQSKCNVKAAIPRLYYHSLITGEPVAANQVIEPGDSNKVLKPNNPSRPVSSNQMPYLAFYNQSTYNPDNTLTEHGKLVVKDHCLYLKLKNGTLALPIFYTQHTYWQDNSYSLRASGHNWGLNQFYQFKVQKHWDNQPVSKRLRDELGMIVGPHESCQQNEVRYIYAMQ